MLPRGTAPTSAAAATPSGAAAPARRLDGRLIAARAWGMALIATVPAGALHGVAHGMHVPLASLAVAFVIAAAIAAPLVGVRFRSRRAGRIRAAVAITASQLFFHGFFTIATAPIGGTEGGHAHHAHGDAAVRDALAGHAAHDHGPAAALDQSMLAAHLAAAALTTAALWYGEALLRGIVDAGRQALTGAARLARVVLAGIRLPQPPRIRPVGALLPLLAQRHALVLQGRGPPALA